MYVALVHLHITKQNNWYRYMYTVPFLHTVQVLSHGQIPKIQSLLMQDIQKSPWSTFVHQNQPTLESLSLSLFSKWKGVIQNTYLLLTIRCITSKRGEEFIMATGKQRPVFNILWSHDCVDVVRKLSLLVSKFTLKRCGILQEYMKPPILHHSIYGLNSLAGSITLDIHYSI